MKILLYFDWSGPRKEAKEHSEKMQVACRETGVEFLGTYGSMNQKWNYCYVFDAKSYDQFMEMARKVPRPNHMTHYITELLIPITFAES
jgi:hypothetical protein